jgi:hypothetical protein
MRPGSDDPAYLSQLAGSVYNGLAAAGKLKFTSIAVQNLAL